MYEFTYHKAGSVADAAAKVSGADDGVLMAGGMTLLPTMKQRLASKHGKGKAMAIMSHRLDRAVYYMLKNQVSFDQERFLRKGA